jgi:altronate dehydratase
LPTSLCAGQIAHLYAQRFNAQGLGQAQGLARFVALPHTEGCGASTQDEFINLLLGYATHPLVRHCLLLEHGCEKTHNAFWRRQMEQASLDPQEFGWASIQLDGGIQAVGLKVMAWFADALASEAPPLRIQAGLEAVRLGLVTNGPLSETAAGAAARLVQWIITAGGKIVLPIHDNLLRRPAFQAYLGLPSEPKPTLAFAQGMAQAGLHLMQTPSSHWVETVTGLVATGVEVVLALVGTRPLPGHPLVPVIEVTEETAADAIFVADLDAVLSGDSQLWADQLLDLLLRTLSQTYAPAANRQQNVGFQITRGILGVSL